MPQKVNPIMARITSPCRTMARLMSEDLDKPSSLRRRLAVRWHRLLCKWCDRYYRDLHLMRDACSEYHLHLDEKSGEILPAERKAAIKEALHRAVD